MIPGGIRRPIQRLPRTDLAEPKLRHVDIYRGLGLTPEKKVQGGDIVNFIELLIPLTEARVIRWKKIGSNIMHLDLEFFLDPEEKNDPINPVDRWEIKIERIFNLRKKIFGLYAVKECFFRIKVFNKFRHFSEDTGEWDTSSAAKDILAMRLEKLMEVELLKFSLDRKVPATRKDF